MGKKSHLLFLRKRKKKYSFIKQYDVRSVKGNRAATLTKLHPHYNVGATKLTRSILIQARRSPRSREHVLLNLTRPTAAASFPSTFKIKCTIRIGSYPSLSIVPRSRGQPGAARVRTRWCRPPATGSLSSAALAAGHSHGTDTSPPWEKKRTEFWGRTAIWIWSAAQRDPHDEGKR